VRECCDRLKRKFQIICTSTPENSQLFISSISIDGKFVSEGYGKSKREAKD